MSYRSIMQAHMLMPAAGAILLGLAWPAGPVCAQMIQPSLYLGPQISFQAHVAAQNAGRAAVDRGAEGAADAPAAVDRAVLLYRPDLARRRANLAGFVKRLRAIDPQGAANVEAILAQGDIIERARPTLAAHGLDTNDIGDAYAGYWISACQAARGDTATPDRKTIAAVKAQAAETIGRKPEFRMAGDATKQEIAETLWLQTMLLDGAVEGAQGKPDQLRVLHEAAVLGARKVGLDLDRMTLGPQGFVPVP